MGKIYFGEILEPGSAVGSMGANEQKVRRRFWRTLRKAIAQLPFIEDVVAAYFCALDPKTPRHTRAILLGALAYFVLPVDWIPDFIAVFGFTDDIAVLSAAIAAIRASLKDSHYKAARQALSDLDTFPDKYA